MYLKAGLIPLFIAVALAAPPPTATSSHAPQKSGHSGSNGHGGHHGQGGNADGLTKVSETLTDSTADNPEHHKRGLEHQKRGIDRHGCYNSGDWMKDTELDKGIQKWCLTQDGNRVPKGKSLNMAYSGLVLGNGKPAIFNGHYTNDDIADGWEINEKECITWMKAVYQTCAGDNDDSQGGYIHVEGYGSVWIDPNEK